MDLTSYNGPTYLPEATPATGLGHEIPCDRRFGFCLVLRMGPTDLLSSSRSELLPLRKKLKLTVMDLFVGKVYARRVPQAEKERNDKVDLTVSQGSKYVRIDQQVSLFTASLIDSIRLNVEMQIPPDLVHAMNLALAFEKKQKVTWATSSRKENWQGTKGYLNTAATSTIPTPNSSNMLSGISESKFMMNPDQKDVQEPEISLHAVTGQKSARTMQLRALMKGQGLLSLVDSVSTHNFISCTAAQRLGMQVQPGTGVNVSGQQGIFHGQQTSSKLQLHLLHDSDEHHSKLEQLLAEFIDLFQEPTGLPPMRNCGHRICLLPGSNPIVVRPYCYPHLQKAWQQIQAKFNPSLIGLNHSPSLPCVDS
ncbi:hypothetical protein BC332_18700 [Capsicum chinense]|nr:hypothetical protein BC332_18700 [Capsicum chinense]